MYCMYGERCEKKSRYTMIMMLMLMHVQYFIVYSIKHEEKFEEGHKQK